MINPDKCRHGQHPVECYQRDLEKARIDAEHILENIMHRKNATGETRDKIAAYLIEVSQKTGGSYTTVKIPRNGWRKGKMRAA